MMSEAEVSRLENACERFGVSAPPGASEASEVHRAALNMVREVTHQAEPSLNGLTVKNLSERLSQLVEWDSHDRRVRSAERIATQASSEVRHLWWAASAYLRTAFAPAFTDALRRFRESLAALDGVTSSDYALTNNRASEYGALQRAADDLRELGSVWRVIQPPRTPLGHSAREGLPQFIKVKGVPALIQARRQWLQQGLSGINAIADLLSIDGVTLEWPMGDDAPQDIAGVIAAGRDAARAA